MVDDGRAGVSRNRLTIREIADENDRLLPQVRTIYMESFPKRERVSFDSLLDRLRLPGRPTHDHMLVAAIEREAVGFSSFMVSPACRNGDRVAWLFYLAVAEDWRNNGIGAQLYLRMLSMIRNEWGCQTVVFEIETEDDAQSHGGEIAAVLARRRKAWYRRLGALQLCGISYAFTNEAGVAVPMEIMIHPLAELTPESAFDYADAILFDRPRQTASLALQ